LPSVLYVNTERSLDLLIAVSATNAALIASRLLSVLLIYVLLVVVKVKYKLPVKFVGIIESVIMQFKWGRSILNYIVVVVFPNLHCLLWGVSLEEKRQVA